MSHVELYYVAPQYIRNDTLRLTGDEYIHAVKVMRKRRKSPIVVVDGEGKRYEGIIESLDEREALVSVSRVKSGVNEPSLSLTLAQAVPKSMLFEWVLEKGTEIGIDRFIPMLCERSVKQPSGRKERWQKKVIGAMKQSGRCRCPQVQAVCSFEQVLKRIQDEEVYIAHPGEGKMVKPESRSVLLLVGPEGGFTDRELDLARQKGARILDLGRRRLRSETAGIVAAAKLFIAGGEI
ncbi:RsmE family RNA methyltransferase [candidate division KSB1 bacterium]|nr:RsmE family RNA methyltransferase [candidate division KSB1 bacterium]